MPSLQKAPNGVELLSDIREIPHPGNGSRRLDLEHIAKF